MKYEEEILKKCGKGNPFRVPEGYFDNLSQRIMNSLPEKDMSVRPLMSVAVARRHHRLLLRLTSIAAACIGLMFVIGLYVHRSDKSLQIAKMESKVKVEQLSDQDVESMVHSSHMDDYTLYQYLSDSEN